MNHQLWDHLLLTASSIEELADAVDDKISRLSAQMETIDITYHRAFDPADAYKEFVAVTLCRAIHKALLTVSPEQQTKGFRIR